MSDVVWSMEAQGAPIVRPYIPGARRTSNYRKRWVGEVSAWYLNGHGETISEIVVRAFWTERGAIRFAERAASCLAEQGYQSRKSESPMTFHAATHRIAAKRTSHLDSLPQSALVALALALGACSTVKASAPTTTSAPALGVVATTATMQVTTTAPAPTGSTLAPDSLAAAAQRYADALALGNAAVLAASYSRACGPTAENKAASLIASWNALASSMGFELKDAIVTVRDVAENGGEGTVSIEWKPADWVAIPGKARKLSESGKRWAKEGSEWRKVECPK